MFVIFGIYIRGFGTSNRQPVDISRPVITMLERVDGAAIEGAPVCSAIKDPRGLKT